MPADLRPGGEVVYVELWFAPKVGMNDLEKKLLIADKRCTKVFPPLFNSSFAISLNVYGAPEVVRQRDLQCLEQKITH